MHRGGLHDLEDTFQEQINERVWVLWRRGGGGGFQTRERDGLFLSTKRAGTEIVLNNKALEKVV